MPDIDFQRIELNLIPKKGDDPVVFYASQYETARPFIADLKWGDTEFSPGVDCRAEIDIRKNDDNLVVITDDVSIDNNEVSVILPVQAVTCIGKNLGQVKIYAADDQLIAALNFILEVQADPLAGGITSETAIDNLTQQIEDIAQEVIGDDYYNKTEVDTLLADKADVSDLPDMSQYYTKTATDTLLNAKADKSDTYTKAQVDTALAAKANSADLATVATSGDYDDLINKPTIPAAQIQSDYTQADTTAVDYIKNKPDIEAMIAAAILAVMPVETQTGNPCTFDTDIATELQGLTADIVSSGGGGTPSTPIPIVGHSALNLDVNGDTFTVQFGQTVYGGVYDANSGKITITHVMIDMGNMYWSYNASYGFISTSIRTTIKGVPYSAIANVKCDIFKAVKYDDVTQRREDYAIGVSPTEYGFVVIADSDYTSEYDFNQYIRGHELAYELATPIEIDVSELSVVTIVGVNNITSDCGGDVTASYKVSFQKYVDDQ